MIPTTGTEKIIISLIMILFAGGFAELLYRILYKLNLESMALKRVKANETELDVNTAEALVLQRELLKDVDRKRVIYGRVQSIASIRQRGGAVDQNALSDTLLGRQSIAGSFARHILGILIILGLVGTLLGLVQAVGEASPMSDPNKFADLEQIAHAIGGTLSGMRTAFSTTLYGLCCTLVLGLTSYVFNRKQGLFLNDLEDFTSTTLLPRFYPDNMEIMLKVSNSLHNTSGAIDAVAKKLTDVAWEIRLDESQQVVAELGRSTTGLSEGIQGLHDLYYRIEAAMKSFDSVANIIKDSQIKMTNALNEHLPKLANESQDLAGKLGSFQTDQETRLSKLLGDIAETIDERNSVSNRLLPDLLEEIRNGIERSVVAQESSASYLNQLIEEAINSESFYDHIKLLNEATDTLKELQTLPQAIERLVGKPDEQSVEGDSFLSQFRISVRELRGISAQLPSESLMQKLTSTLDNLSNNVEQMNHNIEENANRTLWKKLVKMPKLIKSVFSHSVEKDVTDASKDT